VKLRGEAKFEPARDRNGDQPGQSLSRRTSGGPGRRRSTRRGSLGSSQDRKLKAGSRLRIFSRVGQAAGRVRYGSIAEELKPAGREHAATGSVPAWARIAHSGARCMKRWIARS